MKTSQALLVPKGRGFHIMLSVLERGRVDIGSLAVGIAQAGLEAPLGYACERRQFGKPILENQGLQWMLDDMAKDVAATAVVERVATRTPTVVEHCGYGYRQI